MSEQGNFILLNEKAEEIALIDSYSFINTEHSYGEMKFTCPEANMHVIYKWMININCEPEEPIEKADITFDAKLYDASDIEILDEDTILEIVNNPNSDRLLNEIKNCIITEVQSSECKIQYDMKL